MKALVGAGLAFAGLLVLLGGEEIYIGLGILGLIGLGYVLFLR